jgi:tight adherence protein B
MTGLLLACMAAVGVQLVLTPRPRERRGERRSALRSWQRRGRLLLDQAGLDSVRPSQFVAASLLVGLVGGATAAMLFGLGLPALLVAVAAMSVPTLGWRHRRTQRRKVARSAWPRLIEELRVLTGSVGRSIPQALLDVGLRGPEELQPAFRAAQREWALSTDLERTIRVLKDRLDDPTADAACETLLVAAEVGGDIDARLAALAEDRRADLAGRKEAEAKQSGARFARAFVVLVPAGMAMAGLGVGDGRAAYRTPGGQVLVVVGLAVMASCWWWSGRIMRLPEPERVFDR